MDLRLPSFIDFKYYRMYPNPEKYYKSKIMYILTSKTDDMRSEFEKLILKHGPEYQYKTDYIRELAGHTRDGTRCAYDREEITVNQTLLWYLMERELFDLALEFIKQYGLKVTFSMKKFIRKRLRDRHRNRNQKEYFIEGGYKEWPEEIDMDDHYESLTKLAEAIDVAQFCIDESYPSYEPLPHGRSHKKR